MIFCLKRIHMVDLGKIGLNRMLLLGHCMSNPYKSEFPYKNAVLSVIVISKYFNYYSKKEQLLTFSIKNWNQTNKYQPQFIQDKKSQTLDICCKDSYMSDKFFYGLNLPSIPYLSPVISLNHFSVFYHFRRKANSQEHDFQPKTLTNLCWYSWKQSST